MKPIRMFLAIAAVLAACLLAAACTRHGDENAAQLQVHFLDVGQADAALLQYKGKFMLIDTGDVDGRPALVKLLKKKGVEELDAVLLSHPHGDHMGGMTALFQQFPIRQIYDNGQVSRTAMYKNYMKNTVDLNIPYRALRQGDTIVFADDIACHILWPAASGPSADGLSESSRTNNRSLVCKIVFGRFSVLFAGDAQREAEEGMLRTVRQSMLQAAVLKVGHHGSRTSSAPAFIQAVAPEVAVVSCGAGNSYGFPHAEVMDFLRRQQVQVYRTDRNGTVSVVSDGSRYAVVKER